jgi:hypothetical protein
MDSASRSQTWIGDGREPLPSIAEPTVQPGDTVILSDVGTRVARLGRLLWENRVALLAGLSALVVYLFTLQLEVNGSYHPYKMDVGEIQNALPRWGTLHDSGYPLYALLASAFVTALRSLGMPPAAGASLFSAVWGAIAIALLARLALELEVPPLAAITAALLFGLSTSMWVDASIAEVYTMTVALTFAALLAAVRFRRTSQARALYWLACLAGQGLAHHRAFAFLAPGLLLLVLPHWRIVLRKLLAVVGWGLLGLLTYVYIPLQGWAGVTWQFEPITWKNLLLTMADTKADTIVVLPQTMAELWTCLTRVTGLLADDWPPLFLLAGLSGLLLLRWSASRVERWGLTLSWLPYLLVSLIIWEGRISDALLAVKMPVVALAALGLALLTLRAWQWKPVLGKGLVLAWVLLAALLYLDHRPTVLVLTRDDTAQKWITLASQLGPDPEGRQTTFLAFWGDPYWRLTYAQGFEGQIPHLHLVHHNQDLEAMLRTGHQLVTYSQSFRTKSIDWWEPLYFGSTIHLSSVAPDLVEIKTEPKVEAIGPAAAYLHVFDRSLAIREVSISPVGSDTIRVAVAWQALHDALDDYGVAVQVVAGARPCAPEGIVSQVARRHLAGGGYPSSRLVRGEVVRDHVELATVNDPRWLCIRPLVDVDGRLYYRGHDSFAVSLRSGRVSVWSGAADAEWALPVVEEGE